MSHVIQSKLLLGKGRVRGQVQVHVAGRGWVGVMCAYISQGARHMTKAHTPIFFFSSRRDPAAGERSVAKRTVQGTERSEV